MRQNPASLANLPVMISEALDAEAMEAMPQALVLVVADKSMSPTFVALLTHFPTLTVYPFHHSYFFPPNSAH